MAVISINKASFIQKISAPEILKIKQAGKILEKTVPQAFANNAERRSPALSNVDLYETTVHTSLLKTFSAKSSVISVNVIYRQDLLEPEIGANRYPDGTAYYPYRHTSPFGATFDPEDYRDIVNAGRAGKACEVIFGGHKPRWADNEGYWDETISEFPTLVSNALAGTGAISGGAGGALKQYITQSYQNMKVYK